MEGALAVAVEGVLAVEADQVVFVIRGVVPTGVVIAEAPSNNKDIPEEILGNHPAEIEVWITGNETAIGMIFKITETLMTGGII